MLNKLYEDAKVKVAESEQAVARLEDEIRNGEKMRDYLSKQFDDMITWADIYDGCDMETKKMILSCVMKSINVRHNYEIEIDLTVSCEELGLTSADVVKTIPQNEVSA